MPTFVYDDENEQEAPKPPRIVYDPEYEPSAVGGFSPSGQAFAPGQEVDYYSGEPRPAVRPGEGSATTTAFPGGPRVGSTPAELPPVLRQVFELGTGFNNMLAELIGEDAELIDQGMKLIGQEGFLDNPGEGKEVVKKAWKQLGIPTEKLDTFWSDVGETAAQQALLAAVFISAAPAMAGQSTIPFLQQLGQAIMRDPGRALLGAEAVAAIGSVTGRRTAPEGMEDLGEVIGGMIGGPAGGTIGGMARPRGGYGITRGIENIGREMLGMNPRVTAEVPSSGGGLPRIGGADIRRSVSDTPLLSSQGNLPAIQSAIAADKARVDKLLDDAVTSLPTRGSTPDPILHAQRMRDAFRKAYPKARGIEEDYWKRVDLTTRRLPAKPLKDFVKQLRRDVTPETRSDFLPNDVVRKVLALPDSRPIPLKRLIDLRSLVLERSRAQEFRDQRRLRSNLDKIGQEIMDYIGREYPHDRELAKAREFSTWLHDRFTRGPISEFAQTNVRREAGLPDAQQGAERFIRGERPGTESRQVAERLDMTAIEGRSRQYLVEAIREKATEEFGPERALKYMDSAPVKRLVAQFPKVEAEFQQTSRRLSEALAEQKTFAESNFLKLVDAEPQTAVSRIFSAANKPKEVRTIMGKLAGDPEAQKALKFALVDDLFKSTDGGHPTRLRNLLNAKDMRATLNEAFTAAEMRRFDKIINAAADVAEGGEGPLKRVMRGTAGTGSRILGAFLGRVLNTGTIQTPGITSRVAGGLVENLFRQYPPEVLLARAVTDPQWERFLYTRIPSNVKEAQRFVKHLGHLAGASAVVDDIGSMIRENTLDPAEGP